MGKSNYPHCFAIKPDESANSPHPTGSHLCIEKWEHDGKHKCECGHRWRNG